MTEKNLDEIIEVNVPISDVEACARIVTGNFEPPKPIQMTRRELRDHRRIGYVGMAIVTGILAYHVTHNLGYFIKDFQQPKYLPFHLIVP
ncbi:MAG: hypothetical protein AABX85_03500 [Nanoarchaeota archaeon]